MRLIPHRPLHAVLARLYPGKADREKPPVFLSGI
jgi:hypothetical protein